MKYANVGNGLCVVEQVIVHEELSERITSKNLVVIVDRSGSMSNSIGRLIHDVGDILNTLSVGDCVAVGWFSSEREYGWFFPPTLISSNKSIANMIRVLNENANTLSTTCFSRILDTLPDLVNSMIAVSKSESVHFCLFTDGCPVVNDHKLEVKSIMEALKEVSPLLTSSMYLAYGNYPDRQLMAKMAEATNGALVNSFDLSKSMTAISNYVESSNNISPRKEVYVPLDVEYVVGLFDKSIVAYSVENGMSLIPANLEQIYYVTNTSPNLAFHQPVTYKDMEILQPSVNESLLQGMYALSLVANQKGNTELALEILAAIGDEFLVKKLSNAFTNKEAGEAEEAIAEAVVYPRERIKSGRKVGCIPPVDAFSVLDLVEMLTDDPYAMFHYNSPAFRYEKTGLGMKTNEDSLKFKHSGNGMYPFKEAVWNATRLNLSLRTRQEGYVNLPSEAENYGLPLSFPTSRYRTYTIVKDGMIWTSQLPLSMSKESWEVLHENGLIKEALYDPNEVYLVHLDNLPVMNRQTARNYRSLSKCCQTMMKIKELGAEYNLYRKYLDALVPEKVEQKSKKLEELYGRQAVEYLLELGITDNGFNPPYEKEEATDWYEAQTIQIKSYGVGDLKTTAYPDILETLDKVANNKSINLLGEYILKAHDKYTNECPFDENTPDARVAWLESTIKNIKREMDNLRSYIRKSMFAIVLGNQNWEEFDSREQTKLKVDGREFEVVRSRVKVAFNE